MIYKQKFETNIKIDWKEAISNSKKNFEHLKECDLMAQKSNNLVGRYFSLAVADGKVFYQVIKENKTSTVVALCNGICLDDYVDQILGEKSTISKSKVLSLINSQQKLNKLFS
jgi:hypothetical protein